MLAAVQVKGIAVIADGDIGPIDGKGLIEVKRGISPQGGLDYGYGVLCAGSVERSFGGGSTMNSHDSKNDHVIGVHKGVTVTIVIVGQSGEVTPGSHGDSLGSGQQAIDGPGPDGSRRTGIVDVHGLNGRQRISIEVAQLRGPCGNRKIQILVHIGGTGEKTGQRISPEDALGQVETGIGNHQGLLAGLKLGAGAKLGHAGKGQGKSQKHEESGADERDQQGKAPLLPNPISSCWRGYIVVGRPISGSPIFQ